MNRMKDIIDVAVYAGKIMAENGSEIYRCEETIKRICENYGLVDINIFTLSTCIFVTCEHEEESYTCIKRMNSKTTNLTKISKVNQLSRDLSSKGFDLYECKNILKTIEQQEDGNSKLTTALTMSIACGIFGFMIANCKLNEFLVIVLNTFINFYILDYLNRYQINVLLKNVLVSIVITLFAITSIKLHIATELNDIIIGTIMLLVPGVAITNAVRDAFSGDILSGTIRLVEAVTIASGIAIGVGSVLFVYINWWGGI